MVSPAGVEKMSMGYSSILSSFLTFSHVSIMLKSSRPSIRRVLGSFDNGPVSLDVGYNARSLISGHAGPSRLPCVAYPTRPFSATRKGKERAVDVNTLCMASGTKLEGYRAVYTLQAFLVPQKRYFHATARRQAIPLIPATIGILKVSTISYEVLVFDADSSRPLY